MVRLETGFFIAAQCLFGQRFNGGKQWRFVGTNQRNCLARRAGPAGAANPVDVILGDDRQIEIHHLRQVVNIQSACGDIGSDQNLDFAGLETFQRPQAGRLRLVAVDGVSLDLFGEQLADQFINAFARLDENQHLPPAPVFQHFQEEFRLAFLVDRHNPLLDRLDGTVAQADFDRERVVQPGLGHAADFVRESRGEQQGLALFRQRGENRRQFLSETEVEHAVGLVENQRFHLLELDGVLAEKVEQAAGRGHENIDSTAQAHHLRVDTDAAISGVSADRQVLAILTETGLHLFGEFAGRHQHQGADRVARCFFAFAQSLQYGQRKAGRLAGTGLGGGHQIAPGKDGRNGL